MSWYSSTSTASNRSRTSAASASSCIRWIPVEQQVVVVEHVLLLLARATYASEERLELLGISLHQGKCVFSAASTGSCAFTQRL